MPLRWKKDAPETGLRRVIAGPRSSRLRDSDQEYASVHALQVRYQTKGWYWVARNDAAGVPLMNTCRTPVADEATAKADAMAYVKDCIKSRAPTQDQGEGK